MSRLFDPALHPRHVPAGEDHCPFQVVLLVELLLGFRSLPRWEKTLGLDQTAYLGGHVQIPQADPTLDIDAIRLPLLAGPL